MEASRVGAKGKVTPLSSMFPVEEAQNAAHCVQDTMVERHKEMDSVQRFITDNTNLINLVHRLPNDLHHHIMVPFGKAAFFPGQLIHTNEFLVLLGEGYYAERTAKQTIDILKRRGKALEPQVNSLKAVIKDLEAEASFFDRTAAEAVEGLVEIREDYSEEDAEENVSEAVSAQQQSVRPSTSESNGRSGSVDDEEYERIMMRLDELEKEELEAESSEEQEDDECNEADNIDLDRQQARDAHSTRRKDHDSFQQDDADKLNLESLNLRTMKKEESSYGKALPHVTGKYAENDSPLSSMKSSTQSIPKPKKVSFQIPKPDAGAQMSKPTESLKAFTCSIVERSDNLQMNPTEQTSATQPSSSQPSKPVSRFKMQRR